MINGTYQDKTLTDLTRLAFLRLAQAFGTVSGPTQRIAVTDAPQALPTSVTQNGAVSVGAAQIAYGQPSSIDPRSLQVSSPVVASSVLITVETFSIRYTLGGATPTQGPSGVGHSAQVGQLIVLDNPADVASFRFINLTNGSAAALMVTAGF